MSDSPNNSNPSHESGIDNSDLEIIKSFMGREPNYNELMIISKLWYKRPEIEYARKKLINLINYKKPVLKEIYNNSIGVVEIDKDLACVISILSNGDENNSLLNAGIDTIERAVQNITSTGASLAANIYSFNHKTSKSDNTLRDISEFSNAAGIPIIDNSICFDNNFSRNPILNILTLGITGKDRICKSLFANPGDPLLILSTNNSNKQLKDSLFSFLKNKYYKDKKIPIVINSILEKLLVEGILELFRVNAVTGAFSIDRTGIIGQVANIISHSDAGVRLNIDKLPKDSPDDKISKILSRYTPQSLLLIIDKNKKNLVNNILGKWLLDNCEAGEIIKQNNFQCYQNSKLVVDIPGKCLLIQESVKDNSGIKSSDSDFNIPDISTENINEPENYKEVALKLLKQHNIAVKAYVNVQSDSKTGTVNMNINFPSDTGIFKLKGFDRFLTATLNANSKYVSADNKTGIIIMIAKTIKDLICSGSEPLALSLCLNIRETDNKNFKEQFELIYDGIEESIKHFKTPLANFNINLNLKNQTGSNDDNQVILPVIGAVGKLNNNKSYTTIAFKEKGLMIYLIGKSRNDIASSEYLRVIHKIKKSPAPFIDIDFEKNLHNTVKGLIKNHLILSAHNITEGGLFFALLESAIIKGYGFDITSPAEVRLDAFLFGEAQGRVIVTVSPARETEFIDYMIQQDFPFSALGHVTKEELRIDDISYGFINEYKDLYYSVINEMPNLVW